MINLLKKLDFNKKNKTEVKEDILLKEEIRKVCLEMEKTNMWFQTEVDSDLIEACIHQREVLNARYRYLMNKIKPAQT